MYKRTETALSTQEALHAFDRMREQIKLTGWDTRVVDEAAQILSCTISQRDYDAATKVAQSCAEILKEWRYLEYWYFEGAPLSVQIALSIGLQLGILQPPIDKKQRIIEFSDFFHNQIAFKTALNYSETVGGWLFPGEAEMLWESVRRTAALPGSVCEIGSWVGRSTILLASACAEHAPNKRLHIVDDWNLGGQPDLYPYLTANRQLKAEFERNLNPWRSNINIHHGEFKDVFAELKRECPYGLDLVFHDAGHTPKDFEQDLPLVAQLINSGGTLIIHDYVSQHFTESRLTIDEWVRSNPEFVIEKCVGSCAMIGRK